MDDLKTQPNKWGGKRPGAGRPRKQTSYRTGDRHYASDQPLSLDPAMSDQAGSERFSDPDYNRDLIVHPDHIVSLIKDLFADITVQEIADEANRLLAQLPSEAYENAYLLTVLEAAAFQAAQKRLLAKLLNEATPPAA